MHLFSFRSLIFVLGAGALAMLLLHGAPAAGRMDGVGLNVSADLSTSSPEWQEALPELDAMGVTWVREAIPWQQVEPAPGEYRFAWTDGIQAINLDQTISDLHGAGIEMVAVLSGGPIYLAHAYPGQPVNASALLEGWRGYVQAVVNRYGDQIDYWQIGDAPNSRSGWGQVIFPSDADATTTPDPALYAQMLASAAGIIRQADPGDTVLLGGLALDGSDDCTTDPQAFLAAMDAQDVWNDFDVLALNIIWEPYAPETTQMRGAQHDPVTHACLDAGLHETTLPEEIAAVQAAADGFGAKPLWVTRIGWDENALQGQGNLRGLVSALVESDYVARTYAMLLSQPGMVRVFWYALLDQTGVTGYGLDPLGQQTLANVRALLTGSQGEGQVQGQDGGAMLEYRFRRNHEVFILLWEKPGGGENVIALVQGLQGRTVRGYTADSPGFSAGSGQSVPISADGSVGLTINERPVVMVARLSNPVEAGRTIVEDRFSAWQDGLRAMGEDWLRMQQRGVEMALTAWLDNLVDATLQSMEMWVRGIFGGTP